MSPGRFMWVVLADLRTRDHYDIMALVQRLGKDVFRYPAGRKEIFSMPR